MEPYKPSQYFAHCFLFFNRVYRRNKNINEDRRLSKEGNIEASQGDMMESNALYQTASVSAELVLRKARKCNGKSNIFRS